MTRIPIPDGATHVTAGAPIFEFVTEAPKPPAWDSPIPKGPGVWIYEAVEDDAMLAWMKNSGLTWMQFWSSAYRPRDLPYIYEIQAGLHGKRSFDSDMVKVRARLERHALSGDWVGINLNCECPFTEAAEAVFQMVRAEFPDVKIFTGPLGWDVLTKLDDFRRFDGVMTFWNCTRYQRMPEDFWYQAAMANAIGLPWCISVQPVDSETGMTLAEPARFKAALDLAAQYADGINLWKMEDIWRLDTGRMETVTPERLPGILDAIKNVDQVPTERPQLTVHHDVHDSWSFHEVRSLCRIAGRAGFEPVAVATSGRADLWWPSIEDSSMYDRDTLMKFSQWPPKEERPIARAACREMERVLADWVKANYGGE